MRKLANFTDKSLAQGFGGYLKSTNIDVNLQENAANDFDLWIMNEDDFDKANLAWQDFQSNANDPRFNANPLAVGTAPELGNAAKSSRRRAKRSRSRFDADDPLAATVTITLIITSLFATFVLDGEGFEWLKIKLYYSEYLGSNFYEIRNGQLWRLVTPIFMHGGFLHLFFNMLWVYQLGSQIERLEGSVFLLLQTLIFACIVNTAQYLVSGPNFLGMSGVLYGQLGYTWMMSRYSRKAHYYLAEGTVMMMVVWMLLCLTGVFGPVANTQHFGGFAIGAITGYFRSGELSTSFKQYMRRRRGKH